MRLVALAFHGSLDTPGIHASPISPVTTGSDVSPWARAKNSSNEPAMTVAPGNWDLATV